MAAGKTETFVVDTSNILFVLSGAFVGLESIVQRRLGRGVCISCSSRRAIAGAVAASV
jgi:ATP-dependent protease Clp ATPase subunit